MPFHQLPAEGLLAGCLQTVHALGLGGQQEIVGVGLPKITPERQILSNYYSEKFGDGFAFAYRFPGWQKVLQAVGRVIRTEEDTGFALLIDSRLETPEYVMLFPDHWRI